MDPAGRSGVAPNTERTGQWIPSIHTLAAKVTDHKQQHQHQHQQDDAMIIAAVAAKNLVCGGDESCWKCRRLVVRMGLIKKPCQCGETAHEPSIDGNEDSKKTKCNCKRAESGVVVCEWCQAHKDEVHNDEDTVCEHQVVKETDAKAA